MTIDRSFGAHPKGEYPLYMQARRACRDFLGRVDFDNLRNIVKKISKHFTKSLCAPHRIRVLRRKVIERKHGRMAIMRCVLKNKWERFAYHVYLNRSVKPDFIGYRFPRERFISHLGLVAVVGSCVALTGNHTVLTELPSSSDVRNISVAQSFVAKPAPANWVMGTAELKGSPEAVMGAFTYAAKANFTFARNNADVAALVSSGAIVPITGKYIRLKDVSNPYAQPIVVRFIQRLGEQYAATGCGKLVVTSGIRPLDLQETLKNGSNHSVHPTGMAIDLERVVPKDRTETYCLGKLQSLLTAIEGSHRVDVTAENSPRHFHVVAVPHVYEAYLAHLPQGLDPEVKYLARAMYFEAPFQGSEEEYVAIAATIKNRARSSGFPNTILEVVAQGAAGKSAGGCQFSFMCDGKGEDIQELCDHKPALVPVCEKRWNDVVALAKRLINSTEDPTGGAVLYHAISMKQPPPWAKPRVEIRKNPNGTVVKITLPHGDFASGTIKDIGATRFGCANYRGSDVCNKEGVS